MLSEADLMAKRAALRWLAERHPSWTHQELASALQMSHSWVSKSPSDIDSHYAGSSKLLMN